MESDIFKEMFYNLLESYRVDIKKEYQFVYDDFYEHLFNDTIDNISKHINDYEKIDTTYYGQVKFRDNFYKHYSSSQWFYRILKPEENKEVIKELRNRKLKEIENEHR